ncbi:MAG: sigma-70 family RNA polymerase sigma factor [Desulfobacteraceae bacterium]|nr:sigma-70 family RNA polymerase sigma factor [Desulfobacteraceae bacterium]
MEQTVRAKNAAGQKFRTGRKNYDPVQQYMAEIRSHGLVSREEERELARRIREHDDDEAAYKLVVSNLRLVVKIALKFQRFWNRNLLDLIQEGNVGLMQAVRKYDPERNVKFSYYASFWIKAYILKYMQDNWRMVKVVTTEGQRKLFYKLKQERRRLSAMGIEPDSRKLSEQCGVQEKDIVDMDQRLQNRDISLDAPLNEESDTDWVDFLRVDDEKSIESQYSDREIDGLVNNKVCEFRKKIPHRECEILDMRIYSDSPMTLQSLGDRLSLSRERVRQLQTQIVDDLKVFLSNEIHDFEEFSGYSRSA